MKNIVFTSLLAVMVAAPAFADDDPYTNDETYTGYCEIAHIGGTGTGSVTATANFTPNRYYCAVGTYLPAMSNWANDNAYTPNSSSPVNCEPCPANSYCQGTGITTQASENTAYGIYACGTNPGGTISVHKLDTTGYPYSDANSFSAQQCYRTCTTADVPHATSVTGRFYIGDPTITSLNDVYSFLNPRYPSNTEPVFGLDGINNTCAPASSSACATGYHYVAAFDPNAAGLKEGLEQYTYSQQWSFKFHAIDGSTGTGSNYSQMGRGDWEYSIATVGTMRGVSACSDIDGLWTANDPGNSGTYGSLEPNGLMPAEASGKNCWCRPRYWTPSGGTQREIYGNWVRVDGDDFSDTAECAASCAELCSAYEEIPGPANSEVYVLELISIRLAAGCLPNEITVNWGGYGANNNQSQQTQCTYGGDVTTPTTAPTKRGYTFGGWTFTLN